MKTVNTSTLTFYGGAGMVTGSNFLLDDGSLKILIDCGFFQGCDICDDKNYGPFAYNPKEIDFLFITHAHLDHIGRIPKLVREGFSGVIYSTPPTRDLAELMLSDSIPLLEAEARRKGREPIYTAEDVKRAMVFWQTAPYHEAIALPNGFSVLFKDAGHILGSAMIEFSREGKKLVMTGDLGNSPAPLLRDTEPVTDADYLVMESVYGDRNHESRDVRQERLEDTIEWITRSKGTLIIPAFSIERTQEILFEIEQMVQNKKIHEIPVYVDSPLAIHVIEVYKRYDEYFNKDVIHIIRSGDEIFKFPKLYLTSSEAESREIAKVPGPKIIIAGSGMSYGGRIVEHEKQYLSDPNSVLLIVGYQAPGSAGRMIAEGAREVMIRGARVSVEAHIVTISAYSAHKDLDNLLQFINDTRDKVRKVFVAMGETKSASFLSQRARDYLGVDAVVPREGDSFELEL